MGRVVTWPVLACALGLCACGAPRGAGPDKPAGGDVDGDAQAGDALPPGDWAGCTPDFLTAQGQSQPAALIVTSTALAAAFGELAELHTSLGVVTEVITLTEICQQVTCNDSDPASDTAKAVKANLAPRPGLRYVILGGDHEIVPARSVYDAYSNPFLPSFTYEGDFYTDYYYADLSQWDADGDGTYAEDGVDSPDYLPELAVARIPAGSVAEVDGYVAKVKAYLGAYPLARADRALLVSDVAVSYYAIDIDSAHYLEGEGRSLDLLPAGFTVDKLYATSMTPDTAAPRLSWSALSAAFAAGYNLVVHNGHGSEGTAIYTPDDDLTVARIDALTNATRPILLSCACQAGAFNEPDEQLSTDSAGERLVLNPTGGAIAYLGNTTVGLGLAGGSQLIDELLRHVRSNPEARLGDALFAAHTLMPESDDFEVPYVGVEVPVVDQESYAWTQKSAVLLGDPLLPVWSVPLAAAPVLSVSATPLCLGTRLTFTVAPAVAGTLRFVAGASRYQVSVSGATTVVEIRERPVSVRAGFVAPGRLRAFGTFTL